MRGSITVTHQLVIVESPAKAKTIHKYLGKNYTVLASYGHVRDLPSKQGSVDPQSSFHMVWEVSDRSKKVMADIAKAAEQADSVLLATDPDREGEAISWHIHQLLRDKKSLKQLPIQRIVFNEITKRAIQESVSKPRTIDDSLVQAYLARRALDYLVGFTLSPILWRKLPGARSAGRVQSVALRLVVEREQEIERFKTDEYWTIDGNFTNVKSEPFSARLSVFNNEKLKKLSIENEKQAQAMANTLRACEYTVKSIEKKATKRYPAAPFTTSTLQQEASRKLGFNASRTMRVAQKLYEGVSVGGETTGLITYMRTDSVTLSQEITSQTRDHIKQNYGDKYLPAEVRLFKSKAKNAQEAHEAIRPTSIERHPDSLASYLDEEQLKLYRLIWRRTLACQMAEAIFDKTAIDIVSQDQLHILRANGSIQIFDGFLKVYQEGFDDSKSSDDSDKLLPLIHNNEKLNLADVITDQHFTQPPPRYTEASLVKKLEELGIGRPSTYASLMQVIQERDYVYLDKKTFVPSDRGRVVTAFLQHYFLKYVEYDFTAHLEEQLDDIAEGGHDWLKLMDAFWRDFSTTCDNAKDLSVTEVLDIIQKDMEVFLFKNNPEKKCPKCENGELHLKLSRYGGFLGCRNYPDCSYTQSIDPNEDSTPVKTEPTQIGTDPENQSPITLRRGPYGFYLQWDDVLNKQKKPKRVSIPQTIDPLTLTLETALQLGKIPFELGLHPESGDKMMVGLGRFGPYVKYQEMFVSIPKTIDFLSITAEEAVDLITKKKQKPPSNRSFKAKSPKKTAKKK